MKQFKDYTTTEFTILIYVHFRTKQY